jgi:hypothetical protein
LNSIAVAPEAQHDGICRMLLAHCVDEVKSQGTEDAILQPTQKITILSIDFILRQAEKWDPSFKPPEGRKMDKYILDFSKPSPRLAAGMVY